ncbi:MAG: c-type cytochrome [Labilithrix sp.]|nr:c-type cytochrome [Labilithrix sp.]MCW5816161.1 c-type cytochrome [Labilithrix sp.]
MLRRWALPSFLATAALVACARPAPVARFGAPRPAPRFLAAPEAPPPLPPVPAPIVGRLGNARSGSGVLLADLDGRRVAYVADEDASLVRVVDVDDGRELSHVAPGGAPAQLVMLADGRLVASLRDRAKLVVLRGGGTAKSPLVVDASIDVAAEPIGLALTPDDATLVATSGWGRTVTVIDAHGFTQKATHAVEREPRSVVVSSDGKRAFVAHAVGQSLDVLPLDGRGKAKTLGLKGEEEIAGRGFIGTEKRVACQGFALAKSDTGRVFAPHVLVFPGEPVASEGYGGGDEGREAEVFHVPIIDEDAEKVVAPSMTLRVGFDEAVSTSCALPRAATFGKDGLYVTCLGEDSVQLYDGDALNPQDVTLKKWSVPAGPTAIALDEEHDRAVVWSQFAQSLTTIAIGAHRAVAVASTSFVDPKATKEDEKIALGRRLFHATQDRRISSDGRACASCHPDGRDDALVWSSPKGPRQTPMLAGRLDGAAPFGWNGDANDVNLHLVQTMKRLGGTGMEGDDKEALVAYVRAMRPPPEATPAESKGEAIARGAAIFRTAEAGCATCHGEGGDLPDGTAHDVKSRAFSDTVRKFDTPSLRFLSGSAPYFHDGRYADLRTLLVKSDGKMGRTKHLSKTELDDLVTYLETL